MGVPLLEGGQIMQKTRQGTKEGPQNKTRD